MTYWFRLKPILAGSLRWRKSGYRHPKTNVQPNKSEIGKIPNDNPDEARLVLFRFSRRYRCRKANFCIRRDFLHYGKNRRFPHIATEPGISRAAASCDWALGR